MARTGRPEIPINWDLVDLSFEAGCNGEEAASEIGCHPDTLAAAIKKKYKMTFTAYSAWRHSKGRRNVKIATYKKVREGNIQAILHLRKHWFDECDFEVERRIKEKYEKNDTEEKRSTMKEIMENSKEMLKNHGPIAEERPKAILLSDTGTHPT